MNGRGLFNGFSAAVKLRVKIAANGAAPNEKK
jgi:hypothetical protein